MLIDLTLLITPKLAADAAGAEKKVLVGHLGTHFDVMDKVFPLAYTELNGLVFDVSKAAGRDVEKRDVDLDSVRQGMFVAFHTGFAAAYGSDAYFHAHPQLSRALIEALIAKNIAIIGVDIAGMRRGREHEEMDRLCADNGVFVVENLVNLSRVLAYNARFIACTYPMNYEGVTGLPCRVVARLPGVAEIAGR